MAGGDSENLLLGDGPLQGHVRERRNVEKTAKLRAHRRFPADVAQQHRLVQHGPHLQRVRRGQRGPAGGPRGKHARHFARKVDGQAWLDQVTASVITGSYVSPKTAKTTVADWCATWLAGYATRRASTVRQARVHVAQIKAEFGTMPLAAVRPSHVRSWTSRLTGDGLSASYVYALHSRLAQWPAETVLTGTDGGQLGPWALERAMRTARGKVDGLPAGLRYHDLRH